MGACHAILSSPTYLPSKVRMPIRNFNPFKKAPTAQEIYEQNNGIRNSTDKGFQDAAVKAATPIEIKEPPEYKLSEINDSGVYLPPSPPAKEKPNFFSRTTTSTSKSSQRTDRSSLAENEPFNISRESFDSYRRSFDISARSPIPVHDTPVRQSMDSRRNLNAYSPRPSFQQSRESFQNSRESFQRESVENKFEDVGLHDEPSVQQKKRSFFSRFGEDKPEAATTEAKPQTASNRFLSGITGGRKRGQSGTGSELGSMPNERPESKNAQAVEAK